jgi:hypothetical protein
LIKSDLELSLCVNNLNLLILQDSAVLIAEDRQQNFVRQLILRRVPIDVEVASKETARAILEYIPPPNIGRIGNTHVVGNDIHQHAHAVSLELRAGEMILRLRFQD